MTFWIKDGYLMCRLPSGDITVVCYVSSDDETDNKTDDWGERCKCCGEWPVYCDCDYKNYDPSA